MLVAWDFSETIHSRSYTYIMKNVYPDPTAVLDTIIETPILEVGDCSMTFRGGHTYEILEDDTVVYEYKTGPYKGIENDKVFI